MERSSESFSKPDRKTVERNRRIQMRSLCFKLASLVPPQHFKTTNSKDTVSQQNQLDTAASYIKQLRERMENLKERKEKAMRSQLGSSNSDIGAIAAENAVMKGSRLPVLELRDSGSSIEVMLISGLNKNFMFYEVIRVLEEQGAEVVSANFSTVGNKVFHVVHAQALPLTEAPFRQLMPLPYPLNTKVMMEDTKAISIHAANPHVKAPPI